ncbi:MAG: nitroreductase family deazaflavin-dependent oxidoreductase [Deltaproteobacteria bacterium]|nr:nitroreductase family deazaflavin-dependent oxidoreductase [Deltaproteobacteria bacterium]
MSNLGMKAGHRPSRLLRLIFRLPILLYKIGLGWLFGDRFLMLTNIGRKSGLKHQVVLEVLYHNKTSGEYYVLSGWGDKSGWFMNIQKNPEVVVNVGGKKFEALAFQLTSVDAERVISKYAYQHRKAFQVLSKRILGVDLGVTKKSFEELAASLPVICLRPI